MKLERLLPFVFLLTIQCSDKANTKGIPKFSISFTKELSEQAQDGRLLLLLSTNDKAEPRFQINDGLETQLVFGVDVEGMKPGEEIVIDQSAFGYPLRNLKQIPAGEYY
ncbi:MAG: hypothetical protein ACK5WF_17380, partial [Cyclobacteriaceae bacterium]